MGCSLPGSSIYGDSPDKNTGVGCNAFFQGIFPTQGLNPGLQHCRWILYHLSHKEKNKDNTTKFTVLKKGNAKNAQTTTQLHSSHTLVK